LKENAMSNSSQACVFPVPQASPGLVSAVVTGQADKWFFLDAGAGAAAVADRALRAESCLIEPECGDTVLVCQGVAVGLTSVPYILAVLSRADAQQGVLALPGGARIRAEAGALAFVASDISLEGAHSVSLKAPQLAVTAAEGELRFNRLASTIGELSASLGSVRTVAQAVTSTVGRLVQKATNSFRWTENLDESRAGRMRLQVAERFHLKSRHASVIAEGQVKIDAEKIDLG
jgi:hypothetical protein